MKTEKKDTLLAAFAAALTEMPSPALDKINSAFGRSKYASLGSYLEACRPHLARFGLAVASDLESTADGNLMCWTVIRDATGDSVRLAPVPVKVDLAKPQATGSAITYARRYSLSAALGVVGDEDDDANATNEPKPQPKVSMPKAIEKAAPKPVVNEDTGYEVVRIDSVDTKEGVAKTTGKPWCMWIVKTDAGEEFTTFSATVGDRAFGFVGKTAEVLVQEKTTASGRKTLELTDIKAAAQPKPEPKGGDDDIPF